MSALVLEQIQILQWIAVHDQQIGMRAGDQFAQHSFLAHNAGIGDGGRTNDFGGAQDLAANQELAAMVILQLPQQVRSKADFNASIAAHLTGPQTTRTAERRAGNEWVQTVKYRRS